MLAKFRFTHAAIRDAILKIDDKKLSVDRLKALKSFLPTADEVSTDLSCLFDGSHHYNAIAEKARVLHLADRQAVEIPRRFRSTFVQ